jgi:acetyl-CoA carboxylase biotin carboxyl carrier protein
VDIRKIKKLIELLEDSSLTEIEIVEGEESVRLVRGGQAQAVTVAVPQPAIAAPTVAATAAVPAAEEQAFVGLGQRVGVGDTLCIIEAMKMFNQIESDVSGTVVAILAENGQPVEYDQPLFVIR